ncbi:hypothetical protein AgCh_005476 [Apium graveolens]
MQGIAMLLQNRYQRQRLYTRIALGKVKLKGRMLCGEKLLEWMASYGCCALYSSHCRWSTHSGHYYCYVHTSGGMWHSLDRLSISTGDLRQSSR